MRRIFLLLFSILSMLSCSHPDNNVAATQNEILGINDEKETSVNDLINEWNTAWNRHDSASIADIFDIDAVLIHDTIVAKGQKEIAEKFIGANYKLVNNLTTNELKSWQSNDKSAFAGSFNLDIMNDGKLLAKSKGFITILWQKSSGTWKATIVQINTNAQNI